MFNASVRDLEERIVNVLNESEVPIDVKRLVVQTIYQNVKAQADLVILKEIETENYKGDENEQSISENDLC